MRNGRIKTGFTLTEAMVVAAIMVVLAGIAVPAVKELIKSFESSGDAGSVIAAALANARAIAGREGTYAGVRFQQDSDGRQYMIFIVHDPAPAPTVGELVADPLATGTGLASGFRAVAGRKPLRLPESIGVMDLRVKHDYSVPVGTDIDIKGLDDAISNANINEDEEFTDTTTFSIIFSSSGRLVRHDVRVRNRHGRLESTETILWSNDDVFNTQTKITDPTNPVGMFVQDDYADIGLGQEPSRKSFVIYNKNEFRTVNKNKRWSDYLQHLEVFYINPYTGEMVN